jgi:hypothetical protein
MAESVLEKEAPEKRLERAEKRKSRSLSFISSGGSNEKENLVYLCSSHHRNLHQESQG